LLQQSHSKTLNYFPI